MKIVAIAVLAAFCLDAQIVVIRRGAAAVASIAFVNVSTPVSGSGTSTTIATGATSATTGNHLTVCVGTGVNSATRVTGIADTAGNTYTRINGVASAAVGSLEIWHAQNITGHASNVVTATFVDADPFRWISTIQHSGLSTSASSDVSNTGSGNNTTPVTSASTTTVANEALVGCHVADNTANLTAGTGYTLRTSASSADVSVEDRIVSSTGSYTAGLTLSGTVNWLMVLGTFK